MSAVQVLQLFGKSSKREQRRAERRRMHHPGGVGRCEDTGLTAAAAVALKAPPKVDLAALEGLELDPPVEAVQAPPKLPDASLASLQPRSSGPAGTQLPVPQAVILELFGSTPVHFHRPLVDLTGSVNAALWLSCAIEVLRADPTFQADSFEMSQEELESLTGLSRREQETARRKLRKLNLVTEQRGRGRIAFTVNKLLLSQMLYDLAMRRWSAASTDDGNVNGRSGSDTGTHG